MHQDIAPSHLLRALADPTRRGLYERITSSDEITLAELTQGSAVTQGAISQHMTALKAAGLVAERRAGRNAFYRAEPAGLAPLWSWAEHYSRFWPDRFAGLRQLLSALGPNPQSPTYPEA